MFTTSVPKADLTDHAQVFNYVSWTDPKSTDVTAPDVYSVACVANYHSTKMNKVTVRNYKSTSSFGDNELDWSNLTWQNANQNKRRATREKEIDYYSEFETAKTRKLSAVKDDGSRSLASSFY